MRRDHAPADAGASTVHERRSAGRSRGRGARKPSSLGTPRGRQGPDQTLEIRADEGAPELASEMRLLSARRKRHANVHNRAPGPGQRRVQGIKDAACDQDDLLGLEGVEIEEKGADIGDETLSIPRPIRLEIDEKDPAPAKLLEAGPLV